MLTPHARPSGKEEDDDAEHPAQPPRWPATPWPMCSPADAAARLMELTDRPRQARGLFRRQAAHHRFRAVQRAELRHPPHRRRHPVQGPQPDPPSAARLELLPPRAQRELRHPARQPARRRGQMVSRHRRRGVPEHRHHRELRAALHRRAGRRPHLQDGLRADAAAARRARTPTSPSAASRCRARMPRASASCMSTRPTASWTFMEKPADPPAMPDNPDLCAGQHGHLCVRHRVLVRSAAPRRRRSEFQPRFRQGHHPVPGQARQGGGASVRPLLRPLRQPRRRPTGATSARSMPIARPIST